MNKRRRIAGGRLVAKPWALLTEAVNEGAMFAVTRFNKYCPDDKVVEHLEEHREEMVEHIVREVLNAVSERFEVEEGS